MGEIKEQDIISIWVNPFTIRALEYDPSMAVFGYVKEFDSIKWLIFNHPVENELKCIQLSYAEKTHVINTVNGTAKNINEVPKSITVWRKENPFVHKDLREYII